MKYLKEMVCDQCQHTEVVDEYPGPFTWLWRVLTGRGEWSSVEGPRALSFYRRLCPKCTKKATRGEP